MQGQNSNNSIDQIAIKLLGGFSNKGHRLFMDNFFTSYSLINDLETRMTGVSGALKKNRKNISKKIFKPKIKMEIIAFQLNNISIRLV